MKVRYLTFALALMPALLVVDWVNGIVGARLGFDDLPVSPGQMARGCVFLAATLIVLVHARREWASTVRGVLLVGLALFPGFAYGLVSGGGADEIERVFKNLYCPMLVAGYVVLFQQYGVKWTQVLAAEAFMGALAGLSIVAFTTLGVGFATYGQHSTASSGLFTAQNDIGLTMSVTLFASLDLLFREKRLRWMITSACTVAGMLTVGTRTGTLAAFAIPGAVLWIYRAEMRTRRRLPMTIGLVVLMIAALGIAGVSQYQEITSQGYQVRKYSSLLEGEMPRAVLFAGAATYVAGRPAWQNVTGAGSVAFGKGTARALGLNKERRVAEIDWMDLLGEYGLIGVTMIYGYYFWFYKRLMRVRRQVSHAVAWLGFGMLSFFLLHATIAGHALESPLPGGAMAPILAFIWLTSRGGGAAVPARRVPAAAVAAAV